MYNQDRFWASPNVYSTPRSQNDKTQAKKVKGQT